MANRADLRAWTSKAFDRAISRTFRRTRGLESVVLRVANPYGPVQRSRMLQGIVAAFLEAGLRGDVLEIWGTIVRDFVFIDDVIEAMLLAGTAGLRSSVFNVASGEGRSINAVAREMESLLGRQPLRRIHHAAPPADVPVNVLDVTHIRDELGWAPRTSWAEGLRRTAAWWGARTCTPALS